MNVARAGVLDTIVTKAGEERSVRWSNSVIKDESGNVTGVLAVGLDVTDLIAAQEKARQSDRLATIGETMTGMAHESRNALQRIRNSVELLEDEIEDDDESRRYLEKISRAANDLRDLLEEVRAYAAPIKLDRGNVSLPTIWRRAWESLEHKSKESSLLEKTWDEQVSPVIVDARRMEQVFRNLFENTFDACGSDVQVSICFGTSENQFTVKVATTDQACHLKFARNCSTHSIPPNRPGRDWGWRLSTASSKHMAEPLRSQTLRQERSCVIRIPVREPSTDNRNRNHD